MTFQGFNDFLTILMPPPSMRLEMCSAKSASLESGDWCLCTALRTPLVVVHATIGWMACPVSLLCFRFVRLSVRACLRTNEGMALSDLLAVDFGLFPGKKSRSLSSTRSLDACHLEQWRSGFTALRVLKRSRARDVRKTWPAVSYSVQLIFRRRKALLCLCQLALRNTDD